MATQSHRGRKFGRNCKHNKNILQFQRTAKNLLKKGKTNKKLHKNPQAKQFALD